MTTTTPTPARAIKFVSIEPGRISLHGIALTDSEYAVLRGIAERMKRGCVGYLIGEENVEINES